MKTFPCAKINLGLYVTERRPDGYHNLETVFYPIPLCDELEIREASADDFRLEGLPVAGDPNGNLVVRLVETLRRRGLAVPPLAIRLRKSIPTGAGLGGGSSDAAYALLLLNDLLRLGLTEEEMERIVAPLGADCAFFIRHRAAFATGIGDQLQPIPLDLSGLHLVLLKPGDFVSTREAYQGVTPLRPRHDLSEAILRPVGQWRDLIENDFERSVFPQHPTIAQLKARLYEAGALYAAMSGSGSAVFGLFKDPLTPDLSPLTSHPSPLTSNHSPLFQFSSQL